MNQLSRMHAITNQRLGLFHAKGLDLLSFCNSDISTRAPNSSGGSDTASEGTTPRGQRLSAGIKARHNPQHSPTASWVMSTCGASEHGRVLHLRCSDTLAEHGSTRTVVLVVPDVPEHHKARMGPESKPHGTTGTLGTTELMNC